MATFKDRLDRSWNIDITVFEMRKVKNEFNIDFGECASSENKVFGRLAKDPILLVDVLSCLLEDQIKQTGLNERQFAQGIVGIGIKNAADALVEAIVNFSKPLDGAVMKATWEKMTATEEIAAEEVLGVMQELDVKPLIRERINEALKPLLKKSGV
jgi:hypothetical protein